MLCKTRYDAWGSHPLVGACSGGGVDPVAVVPHYFDVRNTFLGNRLAQLSDTTHQDLIRNSETLLAGGGGIDLTYFGQFE